MENKNIGVRLMESDYVQAGERIEPPIPTPIGKLALSIVSFLHEKCNILRYVKL